MLFGVLKNLSFVALGAVISITACEVAHIARDSDAVERLADRVASRGEPERAVVMRDVRGILGRASALALAMVPQADYPLIRKQALELSKRVVSGELAAPIAERELLTSAAPLCLKSQKPVVDALGNWVMAVDPIVLETAASALLYVPEARVRFAAATALAVTANPAKPDLVQALEMAAKQEM